MPPYLKTEYYAGDTYIPYHNKEFKGMQQYNYKMKLEDVLNKYKQSGEEVNIIPKSTYDPSAFGRHLIVHDIDTKDKTVELRRYKDANDKNKYISIWMNIDDISQLYVLNY